MTDLAGIREDCRHLAERLERDSAWADLNRVYLDLAPLLGGLQGAVTEYSRIQGDAPGTRKAQDALARLKRTARQVGLNIRLASPAATAIGLRTALENATATLDILEKLPE